ncbi:MAG: ATP-binding protein [Deltaproteobacteria bacterium]|nr:ATP-binding protein [Deltaproteobacteria bacterium]MBW2535251.1 ATP-binding protein [Deltaproteobacteria bacterium]
MAYRSGRERGETKAAEEGLVADMVRQFADRYAFVRELVQNAVDAGATRIDVRAELAPGGRAVFSVRDDGAGMTRETIEGPLLTLFNSSKDADRTKIGKYGVGFVSVFAIGPTEVVVESWRPGESWIVRLTADHSYELAQGGEHEGSGTSVALLKPLSEGEFPTHVEQIGSALSRWCRHAGLPIRYLVPAPGGDAEPLVDQRIDRPLGVATALSVTQEVDGELIVAGPSAGAPEQGESPSESFIGFYNRGLTLFESTQPPTPGLAGVHVKIQSPHLQHTLSRDNVRHDEAYERVLREAEDLVQGPLRAELRAALSAAARAAAEGSELERYASLLTAACAPPLQLDRDEIELPLLDPQGGRRVLQLDETLKLGDGVLYVGATAVDLTTALARAHVPVVRAAHRSVVRTLTGRLEAGAVQHVQQAFLLAAEVPSQELAASDRALCEATHHMLTLAGARAARVGLAETTGLEPPRGALAVPADGTEASHLLSRHEAATWWTRWKAAPTLLLPTSHEAVKRARAQAEYDSQVAANLLARALLVDERGALGKRASDKLLAAGATATRRPRRRARP